MKIDIHKYMRQAIIWFTILFASFELKAQNQALFQLWPDSTLAQANSALGVDYMSDEEIEAVFYTNLARINPPLFASTFLKEYLKEKGVKKDRDVKELMDQLESTPKMRALLPSPKLTEMARKHAVDMGSSGRTGHQSSEGTSFRDRSKVYEQSFIAINENCNYGNDKGTDAVIDLLIDRKVPNAGHRRNILDPEMTHIGVALEPHVRWRHNFVQDFGVRKQ